MKYNIDFRKDFVKEKIAKVLLKTIFKHFIFSKMFKIYSYNLFLNSYYVA